MNHTPAIPGLALPDNSPYGAYAVDLSQTIRFWNQTAERITGHKAENVIGRPCYEVLQNCSADEQAPLCRDGCPALQAIRENRIVPAYEMSMLCAAGQRKLMTVIPMFVSEPSVPETVLLHLFHESGDDRRLEQAAKTVDGTLAVPGPLPETNGKLTLRELEILNLTALGMTAREISETLHISYNTVRKHTSNMRWKLGARHSFGLVRRAQELGLV